MRLLGWGLSLVLLSGCGPGLKLAGLFFEAGEFSGVNSALTISHALTPVNMTTPYTMEAWVRLRSVPSGNKTLVQHMDMGGSGYRDFLLTAGGLVQATIKTDCSSVSSPTYSTALTAEKNYHIAVVWDGSATLTISVNGASESFGVGPGPITCNFNQLAVGAYGTGTANFFDGWIDEVRISDTQRYSGSFTPPQEPFTRDANTVFLAHFDENESKTALGPDDYFYLDSATISYNNVNYVASPFP